VPQNWSRTILCGEILHFSDRFWCPRPYNSRSTNPRSCDKCNMTLTMLQSLNRLDYSDAIRMIRNICTKFFFFEEKGRKCVCSKTTNKDLRSIGNNLFKGKKKLSKYASRIETAIETFSRYNVFPLARPRSRRDSRNEKGASI